MSSPPRDNTSTINTPTPPPIPSSPYFSSNSSNYGGRPNIQRRHQVNEPSSSAQLPQSDGFPQAGLNADINMQEDIPEIRRNALFQSAIPKVTDATGEKVRESFERFLETFVDPQSDASNAHHQGRFYIAQIHGLRVYELSTLYVDYSHVLSVENGVLAQAITEQYYRFIPFLQKALRHLIKKYEPGFLYNNPTADSNNASSATNSANPDSQAGTSTTSTEDVEKVFQIAFYNLPLVNRIRDLRTDKIGTLMSISGTVTRTSEIRPELYKATFTCDACRTVVDGVEQVFKYTEPTICPNVTCQNKISWTLNIGKSQFIDWQKVRIQENSSEIPTGSMPRT